jgi:4-carboxymuconolactone decarboxylase
VSETLELLRRLAANDEQSLATILAPTPGAGAEQPPFGQSLDRQTRELVRLGALLAVDAGTTSLCWAVELATATGVDERAVMGALISAASAAGAAQLVASAPRLALALGFDLEIEGWDGR